MSLVRLPNLALGLVLILLTALVYWPGLSGGFLFDDFPNIVTNERIHAEHIDVGSLTQASKAYAPGPLGRPLATISFAIDYAIGGKDATVFKVTSLLVHLINTALVFLLTLRLLALTGLRDEWTRLSAAGIALLWAVHPLQVSTVLYVVQRMETLSLTFVLCGLLAYLRGRTAQMGARRGWPWLLASGPLAAIGLLSKETAVLFPIYALALELTVLGFRAQDVRVTRALKWLYAGGLVAGTLLFVFVVLPPHLDPKLYEFRNFTLGERLLSQLRVLPLYLGQMLVPLPDHLKFYYETFPVSHDLFDPATTLMGGLLLMALLGAALYLRRRMPLFSLGILWFFSAHLLTSNVFALELVFEHRNYFALYGVLLALADLVRRIPMRDGPALKRFAVAMLVICFGALGMIRSATWGSPLHLAMDIASKNPTSPRAANDMATLYFSMAGNNPKSPFFDMSMMEFERASRLPGSSPLPEQGLILLAATSGQEVRTQWWDRIVWKLEHQPIGPEEGMTVAGLVKQRYEGVELDDRQLARTYTALLEHSSQPAHFYAQFGDHALNYLHDDAMATRMFVAAVERSTASPEYALQLFAALTADDHTQQAQAVRERAEALGMMPRTPAANRDVSGAPGPQAAAR